MNSDQIINTELESIRTYLDGKNVESVDISVLDEITRRRSRLPIVRRSAGGIFLLSNLDYHRKNFGLFGEFLEDDVTSKEKELPLASSLPGGSYGPKPDGWFMADCGLLIGVRGNTVWEIVVTKNYLGQIGIAKEYSVRVGSEMISLDHQATRARLIAIYRELCPEDAEIVPVHSYPVFAQNLLEVDGKVAVCGFAGFSMSCSSDRGSLFAIHITQAAPTMFENGASYIRPGISSPSDDIQFLSSVWNAAGFRPLAQNFGSRVFSSSASLDFFEISARSPEAIGNGIFLHATYLRSKRYVERVAMGDQLQEQVFSTYESPIYQDQKSLHGFVLGSSVHYQTKDVQLALPLPLFSTSADVSFEANKIVLNDVPLYAHANTVSVEVAAGIIVFLESELLYKYVIDVINATKPEEFEAFVKGDFLDIYPPINGTATVVGVLSFLQMGRLNYRTSTGPKYIYKQSLLEEYLAGNEEEGKIKRHELWHSVMQGTEWPGEISGVSVSKWLVADVGRQLLFAGDYDPKVGKDRISAFGIMSSSYLWN